MIAPRHLLLLAGLLPQTLLGNANESAIGQAVERHLPGDEQFTEWSMDPERLAIEAGDRLETREVVTAEVETVKLDDVVPPIQFQSGVAKVPDSTVEELREVLNSMRHRNNVRLNLVGHADNQPLSVSLAERYIDNEGLSRERAGEVAEFFQRALDLPPEALSYEWAGDSLPVASNGTLAGRAQNRRVEVEVWYDVLTDALIEEEFVVTEEFRKIKICRMETVCKLRYVEGHARRARVQNLVAPLHYEDSALTVTPEFSSQIEQTLVNLSDKRNVVVKFIGYTDNVPLAERDSRIYGDHTSLSKARAHRIALAIKDQLDLSSATVESDGLGTEQAIARAETLGDTRPGEIQPGLDHRLFAMQNLRTNAAIHIQRIGFDVSHQVEQCL